MIGALPYGKADSAPRAISEMLACDLPVVVLDETPIDLERYKYVFAAKKDNFWTAVRGMMQQEYKKEVAQYYSENLSMNVAVEHLKKILLRSGA
jgi:hypothetical protein